ncbi:MAG: hypothetical protein FWC42_05215 [Proteobacteria bacterium]|nr:hypothetical protein [Pseudomonadota bacterium]
MNKRFLIFVLIFVSGVAQADTPLPPPEKTRTCSPSGAFCAASDPKTDQTIVSRSDGGAPTWEVPGWHRWLFVTDNGKNIIVDHTGGLVGQDATLDTPVLSFYSASGLLRTVRLGDLYQSVGQLQKTVSHYAWRISVSLDKIGRLIVKRLDGSTVAFDPATGRSL